LWGLTSSVRVVLMLTDGTEWSSGGNPETKHGPVWPGYESGYVPIPNTYSPPYRNYSLIDGSSLWYLTSREGIVGYSTLNVN